MSEPYWYGLFLVGGVLLLLTVLILIMIPIVHHVSKTPTKRGFSSRWYIDYFGLIAISICFYVAWGFGVPAFRPMNLGIVRFVFEIIFVVGNAILGLLMIFVYCFLSEQVKALYCCARKEQYDLSETSRPADRHLFPLNKDQGLYFENEAVGIEAPPPDYSSLQSPEDDGIDENPVAKDDLGKEELEVILEFKEVDEGVTPL